jgi:DNA-binding CsgD family transcriptional regulator
MDASGRQLPVARLLGRTAECLELDALLDHVRSGRSGVLVLRGEAGIGKTALLRHQIDAASGFVVTRCAGVESEMELPFAGLHELCSPLVDGLASLPAAHESALSIALGLETGESPDKLLVALGALGLLAAASEHVPMLCVVEDAHWLDQASAEVLGFVARRLLAEPLALMFAVRTPLTAPDYLAGLPELNVTGLDEDSAGVLLDSVGAVRVYDGVRARIIEETQGNPLALLELGRRMGAAGSAGGFATIDDASLAHRIEDEYVARLHALPRDTQQLVLLAATDPVGDTALIRRAAMGLGLRLDAVDAAVEAGLLISAQSLRFRHPLMRSAVYHASSTEQRRATHEALAAVSDPDLDHDRRAWHHAYAASGPDEKVAAELIGSADRAQKRGGLAAAAAFWDRAVALTPDRANRSSRALVAAQAKYASGDFEAAYRLLATAESGQLTDTEQATAELVRGQMTFTMYRGRDAPTLLFQAAKRFQALDIQRSREGFLQALIAASYAGRLGDPVVRLRIALAARDLPLDPTPTTSVQLLVHGVACWMADGYAAAAATLKSAVRQYRDESLDAGVIGYGFNVMAMHLCDDDAWFAVVNGEVEMAREIGMLSWLPFGLDSLAEFYAHAGDLTQAEALLLEANRIDPTITAVTSLHISLLLAAWRGDVSAAQAPMKALAEGAETRGEGWLLDYNEYAKAVLYNGVADYTLAIDAAEKASAAMDFVPCFPMRALYELVEAATHSDELERAAKAAERLSMLATASGTDFALGLAARCRALLVEGDTADELHREAIERLSRTRMAIYLARARLSYGEWLRRKGRRIDARAQLKPAYVALAAMGAEGFAERAHRELQATGERVRRRTQQETELLTPQEEQIAQLARDRRTNAEIGAQLFLSARTVEWHLRKIFAKLEIKSRRELDTALTNHEKHG